MSSDNETSQPADPKPSGRKTGTGSRIKGAHTKGAKAADKSTARGDNPYLRPNMRAAWFAGHDSMTGYKAPSKGAE